MRLCVIGAGYVGLVTAACFAEMGNQVRCVERDRERVARLRRGEMPIYEPGLESILRDQLDAARLTFTASLAEGLADAEVVFIAVGTPCGEDGSADLSHVLAVAEQLGAQLRQACIVVNKSTVPVGTAERVEEIIRLGLARRRKRFRGGGGEQSGVPQGRLGGGRLQAPGPGHHRQRRDAGRGNPAPALRAVPAQSRTGPADGAPRG